MKLFLSTGVSTVKSTYKEPAYKELYKELIFILHSYQGTSSLYVYKELLL